MLHRFHLLCTSCWRWNSHRGSPDGRCSNCGAIHRMMMLSEQDRRALEKSIAFEEAPA